MAIFKFNKLRIQIIIMKCVTIAALVLVLLFFIGSAEAELECNLRLSNCQSGETAMVYLSATTNAHLSTFPTADYNQIVCCRDTSGVAIGTDCPPTPLSAVFLRLSSATNAHAEAPEQTNYLNPVCLSLPGGIEVNCQRTTTGMSCETEYGADYECLTGLSDVTNAHAMRCTSPIKICCKTLVALDAWFDPQLPEWTITSDFDMSWTSEHPGTDTYDVEYSTDGGNSWTLWFGETNLNTATFTGGIEGTTHDFRVRINYGGGARSMGLHLNNNRPDTANMRDRRPASLF